MKKKMRSARLKVLSSTVILVLAAMAVSPSITEAAAPWHAPGIYLVTVNGTSAGAPIFRVGLLGVAPGASSQPGPTGVVNDLDLCLIVGNPYAFSPTAGDIFVETHQPLCESAIGGNSFVVPQNFAAVTATPSTGLVTALFFNLFGGFCSASLNGGNPNAFVGGSTSGILSSLFGVCSGFMSLTFSSDGSVNGRVNVWGFGGFGTVGNGLGVYSVTVNGKLISSTATAAAASASGATAASVDAVRQQVSAAKH